MSAKVDAVRTYIWWVGWGLGWGCWGGFAGVAGVAGVSGGGFWGCWGIVCVCRDGIEKGEGDGMDRDIDREMERRGKDRYLERTPAVWLQIN